MRNSRRWLIGFALALVVLGFAGSCDEKGLGDAPVGDRNEAPRDIIVMPDTFANVAVVCDGPVRIYVTTRDAPPVVVENHPACVDAEPLGGE